MDENGICRISKHELLFEFRLIDKTVERRILNADSSPIDNNVSDWKPASPAVIDSMQAEHQELRNWLHQNPPNDSQPKIIADF